MAVTTANPAPYAPASAIIDLIDRYRNRGLSKPFTAEVLARAGVSDSLIPRTLYALQALELIGEDLNPTATLEAIRLAPEPELKKVLEGWIKGAYADVLMFVNPSDDESAVRDAFRAYNPPGQQGRMVTLFLGLCRFAGMRADDQSNAAPRPAARKSASSVVAAKKPSTTAGANKAQPAMLGNLSSGLPAPIAGLLAKLPPDGGTWTQSDRDKFEKAFSAMLDFSYSIAEPKPEDDPLCR